MDKIKQKIKDIFKLFDKDGIVKNYVKVVPYFKKYWVRTCLA